MLEVLVASAVAGAPDDEEGEDEVDLDESLSVADFTFDPIDETIPLKD